jgi:dipeptidyl-peptidase 4
VLFLEESMRVVRFAVIAVLSALVVVWSRPVATAPAAVPGYQQFLSPASPLEVVAARKVDRIAWVAFEEGKRNAYTAAAPGFTPVRLTNFMKDDGIDMSDVQISDDGSTVVFVRGTAPNREGWVGWSRSSGSSSGRTP